MIDARTAYAEAQRQINDADIPATVYRTATRLLQLVPTHGSTVILTKVEMLRACGTDAEGTMRSHLWHMSRTKIVHFSTNERVYVTFLAYVTRAERANPLSDADYPNDEPIAAPIATDDDRALSARYISQDARNSSQNARNSSFGAGVKAVGLGGLVLTSDQDQFYDQENTQTKPTQPQTPVDPPTTPEQVWVYELLTDPEIDMMPGNAAAAARLHTSAYVVKCVASWRAKPDARGVGLLVDWLVKRAGKFKPDQPNPAFVASDLYRRHYARLEVLADPPDWFWALPEPPKRVEFLNADGDWVELAASGGGR